MKKLQITFISCLAGGLVIGCGGGEEEDVDLGLEDIVMEVPANAGGAAPGAPGPAGVPQDPDLPPPPPEPGGAPAPTPEPSAAPVSPEKVESLIRSSVAAEGDAGLIYVIQEAVENYYRKNRALPANLEALVNSGDLETRPKVPKGKKVRINGKNLKVTIEEEEGDGDN